MAVPLLVDPFELIHALLSLGARAQRPRPPRRQRGRRPRLARPLRPEVGPHPRAPVQRHGRVVLAFRNIFVGYTLVNAILKELDVAFLWWKLSNFSRVALACTAIRVITLGLRWEINQKSNNITRSVGLAVVVPAEAAVHGGPGHVPVPVGPPVVPHRRLRWCLCLRPAQPQVRATCACAWGRGGGAPGRRRRRGGLPGWRRGLRGEDRRLPVVGSFGHAQ
mmetsp:Transcript_21240/g.33549  ORF Transcript_21240/g.33549 Transcript_21240/m.33549 type:complete len:221 (-) Transcript_21240:263-925(-)